MDERAHGLVLRVYPLTETSLIVHWLTQDLGRMATVAKGARRPKSPFRGKLDLFYLADFSFSRSRRSELHTLREVSLRETHNALRRELGYLQQAAYCAALVEQTTERDTPLSVVFGLMTDLLQHLPAQAPEPQTILGFELKLLAELGLKPNLDKTKLSPGARQLVQALTERDWAMIGRLKFSPQQITELTQFLHGFLIYHLGKMPAGRASAIRPSFD
jgi:DNA repair protein RecO (recombination protein O)